MFYDNGGAHTGCEGPHQSRVGGRLWFISLFSQEFQDSISPVRCNEMKKCSVSARLMNLHANDFFIDCSLYTHTCTPRAWVESNKEDHVGLISGYLP